jgi:hypothetical protein
VPHTEGLAKFSLYNVIFLVAKLFRLSITLAVHSIPTHPHQINLSEGICLFAIPKARALDIITLGYLGL